MDEPEKGIKIDFFRASVLIITGIGVVLILGSLFWRELFWDGFLWRYYLGPVYADAEDREVNGISEGYNPVNTLTYGLILAWAVYWIYRLFQREGIGVDARFAIAIIPYILVGSTLRVLEDAEFFSPPFIYLMISPLIYIVLGLFTLLVVYSGVRYSTLLSLPRTTENRRHSELFILLTGLLLFTGYLLIYLLFNEEFVYIENPGLAGALTAAIVYLLWRERERPDGHSGFHLYTGAVGGFLLLIALYHLSWWGAQHPDGLRLYVIPAIIGLALLCWAGTLWSLREISRRLNYPIETGAVSLNSLMIFSQFLDGAATFTGIDFFGYHEKHVLPSFLISLTGTAAVMFLLKFVVLMLVIYLLDVEYRKMMTGLPVMNGLIRLVVIILGMAPGTRDMLRLALGT